uniref:Uncharacterized protein n=1 Tax=Romanomermis culicivorax TaxID=13658 RepID=A0A915HZL8_ROMCU
MCDFKIDAGGHIVLLQMNADPNFLCKDADFAKYLAGKVNGVQFVTNSQSTILMRLIIEGLLASECLFFTKEELKEVIGPLDRKGT